MTKKIKSVMALPLVAGALLLGGVCVTTGCEPKEKVVEVDTPAGDVDVEKSKTDGDVDVKVDGE